MVLVHFPNTSTVARSFEICPKENDKIAKQQLIETKKNSYIQTCRWVCSSYIPKLKSTEITFQNLKFILHNTDN